MEFLREDPYTLGSAKAGDPRKTHQRRAHFGKQQADRSNASNADFVASIPTAATPVILYDSSANASTTSLSPAHNAIGGGAVVVTSQESWFQCRGISNDTGKEAVSSHEHQAAYASHSMY